LSLVIVSRNILDPGLIATIHTESYAKSALCLFVPFRDVTVFTTPQPGTAYTSELQTAMQSGTITEITQQ